jgi:hypothetical protein
MYRREKGRGGHGFSYSDLKGVWGSGDDYAIVTHIDNRAWQLWWRHPERGWFLQSWHRLLNEAKDEAENPRTLDLVPQQNLPGTYVCAEWKAPYSSNQPMMVRCQEYTAGEIASVFDSLGCSTYIKVIA